MKQILMKSFLTVLILSVLLSGVNYLRLVYEEKRNKNIVFNHVNDEANAEHHQQDNYVLYTTGNGLKTAPLLFGERLYLYSIEEDKSFLLQNAKGPFAAYRPDYSMEGNRVYYQMDLPKGGGTGDYQYLDIASGEISKRKLHSKWSYAAGKNDFYAIRDDGIYSTDWKTGEQEKLIEGNEDDYEYITIKNRTLYAYNLNENCLVSKELETGREERYPFDADDVPHCIEYFDTNHLMMIGGVSGNLIKYDLKQKKQETLVNLVKRRPPEGASYNVETCKLRDGYLYCNDEKMNILKVNVRDGKKSRLIRINDYLEGSVETREINNAAVGYCTDYITIEISYEIENFIRIKERKQLLIFTYEGNLVKSKRLVPEGLI